MTATTRVIGRVKLRYRGAYSAEETYHALDWVSMQNGVAFCVMDNTTGISPTTDSARWELVSTDAAITAADSATLDAQQAAASASAATSSALAAARNTLYAVSHVTSRAAGGGLAAYQNPFGVSIRKYLNVYNEDTAQMESVCWPWVVRVDDKLENPLGKYYMYYSTDHAGNRGWIDISRRGWLSI